MIFTDKHTKLLQAYLDSSSNKIEQDRIYTALQPLLDRLISIIIKKVGICTGDIEDIRQDILIRCYTHILPALNASKLKAAQNYLYVSIKNYYISIVISLNKVNVISIDDDDAIDIPYVGISSYERQEMYNQCIDALKFRAQTPKQKEFIRYLIEYLESNNNELDGSRDYIINKMGISEDYFRNIVFHLNLSGKNWGDYEKKIGKQDKMKENNLFNSI